jgi:hypothetical protein
MHTENAMLVSPEMATAPVILEPERPPKLSWAGLFGGIAVSVGVWLLLTALGLAINLSGVEPTDSLSSLKGIGIATGIWSLVVWVVALFAGGVVAARTAGILDRPSGAIHGAVLWALASILSIMLVGGVIRSVVRGAMETAGTAATAAAGGGSELAQTMGLDMNEIIAPMNERLRAEGKPIVTPPQVQAALRGVTMTAVREGRLDKETIVRSLTENTALSQRDARDAADRLEARLKGQVGAVGQDIKTGALTAADAVGKAMWWLFFGMTLGLAAAMLGATFGVSNRQRRAAAGLTRPVPLATSREAHA